MVKVMSMSLGQLSPSPEAQAVIWLRCIWVFSLGLTMKVIQGRIVGSVMNPVCHAASDYHELLETAKAEK